MGVIQLPLEVREILKIIPHQYPFLLVDRVLELEPLKYIKALKNVTINEAYFSGHFPAYPVMPGVLIIEAMAQTAAILAKLSATHREDNELYLFAAIDKARFKKTVIPGDTLILEAGLLTQKITVARFKVKAFVEKLLVAEAIVTCAKKTFSA